MKRPRGLLSLLPFLLACRQAPQPATGREPSAGAELRPDSTPGAPVLLDSADALQQARDRAVATYVAAREQFGTTEGRIRTALGTPDTVQVTPLPNRHDSTQTDTVIRLYYPGVKLGLYRVALTGTDLVWEVLLSRQLGKRPLDVGIGSTREQLETVFGPATEPGQDDAGHETLGYLHEGEGVTFVLDRGAVTRIEWTGHVD
jgi:hypothetical protein